MELKELYGVYGELCVQAEILQGRINETKKKIAEALSKPPAKEQVKEDEQGQVH